MNPDSTYSKMRQNGLYQGTKWQYRWAAPQYVSKMAEWKGEDTLAAELSEFFDRKMFNQGNEPDIHTPFMFNLFVGLSSNLEKYLPSIMKSAPMASASVIW